MMQSPEVGVGQHGISGLKPHIENHCLNVTQRQFLHVRGRRHGCLIAEMGCGSLSIALNGILPDHIAYYGIDISGEMLATADVGMRQTGLSPQLKQADILSIPYADQSFDFVMAAHVLEHLPEPLRALNEMIRVLKPGGVLFVCMTRRSVFGALIQLHWRTWAITERQGVAWLRDCRLTEIGFRPINLGFCAGNASIAFWARRPTEVS